VGSGTAGIYSMLFCLKHSQAAPVKDLCSIHQNSAEC
jgi:hypothetical protein